MSNEQNDLALDDLESFYGIDLDEDEEDVILSHNGHDDHLSNSHDPYNPSGSINNAHSNKKNKTSDDNTHNNDPNHPLNINSLNFDLNKYVQNTLQLPMNQLLQRVTDLGDEKQALDVEMQTLVYENYNKFITATDIIRSMNSSFNGIEKDMKTVSDHLNVITQHSAQIVKTLNKSKASVAHFSSLSQLLQSLRYLFKLPSLLIYYLTNPQLYGLALRSYDTVAPFLHRYKHLPSFYDILLKTNDSMAKIKSYIHNKIQNDCVLFSPYLYINNNGLVTNNQLVITADNTNKNGPNNHTTTTNFTPGNNYDPNVIKVINHVMQIQYTTLYSQSSLLLPNDGKNEISSSTSVVGAATVSSTQTAHVCSKQDLLLFLLYKKSDIINSFDLLLLSTLCGNAPGSQYSNFIQRVESLLLAYIDSSVCAVQHPQQSNFNYTTGAAVSATSTTTPPSSSSPSTTTSAAAATTKHALNNTNDDDRDVKHNNLILINDIWVSINNNNFDLDTHIAKELVNEVNIEGNLIQPLPNSPLSPDPALIIPNQLNGTESPASISKTSSTIATAAASSSSTHTSTAVTNKNSTNTQNPNLITILNNDLYQDCAFDAQLQIRLAGSIFEKYSLYGELYATHHSHIFISLLFVIHYTKQRLLLPLIYSLQLRINNNNTSSDSVLLASIPHIYNSIVNIIVILNNTVSNILNKYIQRIEFFTAQLFSTKPLLEQRQRVAICTSTPSTPGTSAVTSGNVSVITKPQSTLTKVQLAPCPMQLSMIGLHTQIHLNTYISNLDNFIISRAVDQFSNDTCQSGTRHPTQLASHTSGDDDDDHDHDNNNKKNNCVDHENQTNGETLESRQDEHIHSFNKIPLLQPQLMFKRNNNIFPSLQQLQKRFSKDRISKTKSSTEDSKKKQVKGGLTNHILEPPMLNNSANINNHHINILPYSAVSLLTRDCAPYPPSRVVEVYSIINSYVLASMTEISTALASSASLISTSLDDILLSLDHLTVNVDPLLINNQLYNNNTSTSGGLYSEQSTLGPLMRETGNRPTSATSSTKSLFPSKYSGSHHGTSMHNSEQLIISDLLMNTTAINLLSPQLASTQSVLSTIAMSSAIFLYNLCIKHYNGYLILATNILSSISAPVPFNNNIDKNSEKRLMAGNELQNNVHGENVVPISTMLSNNMDYKLQFKQHNELFSILLLNDTNDANGDKAFDPSGDASECAEYGLMSSKQLYNLDQYTNDELKQKQQQPQQTRYQQPYQSSYFEDDANFSSSDDDNNDNDDIDSHIGLNNSPFRTHDNSEQKNDQFNTDKNDILNDTSTNYYFVVRSWVYALFNHIDDQYSLAPALHSAAAKATGAQSPTGVGGGLGGMATLIIGSGGASAGNTDISSTKHSAHQHGRVNIGNTTISTTALLSNPKKLSHILSTKSAARQQDEVVQSFEVVKQYCNPNHVSQQFSTLIMSFFTSFIPLIDLHTIQYKQSFLNYNPKASNNKYQHHQSSSSRLLTNSSQHGITKNMSTLQHMVGYAKQLGGTVSPSPNGTVSSPAPSLSGASGSKPPQLSQQSSTLRLASILSTLSAQTVTQLNSTIIYASGALATFAPGLYAISSTPMTYHQHQQQTSYNSSIPTSAQTGASGRYTESVGGNSIMSYRNNNIPFGPGPGTVNYSSLNPSHAATVGSGMSDDSRINYYIDYNHNEKQLECKSILLMILLQTLYKVTTLNSILCFPDRHTHIQFNSSAKSSTYENQQIEVLLQSLTSNYGFTEDLVSPNNKDINDAYEYLCEYTSPLSLILTLYNLSSPIPSISTPQPVFISQHNNNYVPPLNYDQFYVLHDLRHFNSNITPSHSQQPQIFPLSSTNNTSTTTSPSLNQDQDKNNLIASNNSIAYKLYLQRNNIFSHYELLIQPTYILVLIQSLNLFYSTYLTSNDLHHSSLYNDAVLCNTDVFTLSYKSNQLSSLTSTGPQFQQQYRSSLSTILSSLLPLTQRVLTLNKQFYSSTINNIMEYAQLILPNHLDFVHATLVAPNNLNPTNNNPNKYGVSGGHQGSLSNYTQQQAQPFPFPQNHVNLMELKIALINIMKGYINTVSHLHNNINLYITRITNNILHTNLTFGVQQLKTHVVTFNRTYPIPVTIIHNYSQDLLYGNEDDDALKIDKTCYNTPLALQTPMFVPWKTTPSTISISMQLLIAYLDHLHVFIHSTILNLDPPKQREKTIDIVSMKYVIPNYPRCCMCCTTNGSDIDALTNPTTNNRNENDDDDNYEAQATSHNKYKTYFSTLNTAASNISLLSATNKLIAIQSIDCRKIFRNSLVNIINYASYIMSQHRLDAYDVHQIQIDFTALLRISQTLCHDDDTVEQVLKAHVGTALKTVIYRRFSPHLHDQIITVQNTMKQVLLQTLIHKNQPNDAPTAVASPDLDHIGIIDVIFAKMFDSAYMKYLHALHKIEGDTLFQQCTCAFLNHDNNDINIQHAQLKQKILTIPLSATQLDTILDGIMFPLYQPYMIPYLLPNE